VPKEQKSNRRTHRRTVYRGSREVIKNGKRGKTFGFGGVSFQKGGDCQTSNTRKLPEKKFRFASIICSIGEGTGLQGGEWSIIAKKDMPFVSVPTESIPRNQTQGRKGK